MHMRSALTASARLGISPTRTPIDCCRHLPPILPPTRWYRVGDEGSNGRKHPGKRSRTASRGIGRSAPQRISRPMQSTTLPPIRGGTGDSGSAPPVQGGEKDAGAAWLVTINTLSWASAIVYHMGSDQGPDSSICVFYREEPVPVCCLPPWRQVVPRNPRQKRRA